MSALKKIVLIHTMRDSVTNLRDSIAHFKPHYVYIVTPKASQFDKPASTLRELDEKDEETFGPHVGKIEHHEMRLIHEPWSGEAMIEVHQLLGEIKDEAERRADKENAECIFYAGLSDGPGLISPSIAFSAVVHRMETYFTRGRRPIYEKNYTIVVENLTGISKVQTWLAANEMHHNNLKYLQKIVDLEEDKEIHVISTKTLLNEMDYTEKAINSAIKILREYNLIRYTDEEAKRNREYNSTTLGKLVIQMY